MVQVAPTNKLVPQLLAKTNEDAFVPVTAMLVIVKFAVPVFVIVTDCDPLEEPTVVAGYESLVAESVTGPAGATPVPVNAILCGEVLALSEIVTAAVRAPVVVGAKWPWMVQLAPTATLVPQLFANTNEDAFVPVTAMLVIDNAASPVLVSVTDRDPLDKPTFTEPYERLVAERVTGGSRPVPLNAIDCGELPALSVMVTAAVNEPVVVGAKWPWMVHVAPTTRLVPQVLANTKEDAFVPVTAMLAIDNTALPLLVRVTDRDTLDEPTSTEPYERLVAERVTSGATPVPLNEIVCVAPAAFRLLSDNTALPEMLPTASGLKSKAMVQLDPPSSSKDSPELAVVCRQVEEGSHRKLGDTLGLSPVVGSGKFRMTLPILLTVTACGP